jgi:hypothetical protein
VTLECLDDKDIKENTQPASVEHSLEVVELLGFQEVGGDN